MGKREFTLKVAEPAHPNETASRGNLKCPDGPVERPFGFKCRTLYEYAIEACERGAERKAMGWRTLKDIHEDKKTVTKVVDGKETEVEKTWMYYELSGYEYITYKQLLKLVLDYGRGLAKIGLRHSGVDKLHIFASTSHRWLQTFLAAQTNGIVVVTAYDTLGESGLLHSMSETETRAVFTDNSLLSKLVKPLENLPNLKYIIYSDKIDPEDKRQGGKVYKQAQDAIDKIKEIRPDIEFYYVEDVIQLGRDNPDLEFHPPEKEDVACIMYTSGSTGYPKGVVMTNAAIIAGVAGASVVAPRELISFDDRIICFLPLAHILELTVELCALYWGATLGYAGVKTLVDTSMRNCKGDLAEFQPTIMVSVAAVWESVRKGVIAKIHALPKFKQKIFWAAYYTKLKFEQLHIPGTTAIGNIFFKKVREATGGRLRYILNGGSSISKDTQTFISNLICPMLLGYGLTETVANAAIVGPEHFSIKRPGTVGDVTGSVTIKLVTVEELGYFAKNNQGEVWIKGNSVMREYFKNEKETSDAMEDGWFKTGDIGEWDSRGQLRLIDRKKNLVKTLNGEYIALEKLESIYRSCKYVANVCVYADQHKVKPVAIIVPNVPECTKLATKLGLMKEGDDLEDLYDNKQLKREVLNDMLKVAKSQGLQGIELILGFAFAPEEWTPQNGMLTSAQKLQRRKIFESVSDTVNEIYKAEG